MSISKKKQEERVLIMTGGVMMLDSILEVEISCGNTIVTVEYLQQLHKDMLGKLEEMVEKL